jgi:hypothetical protein
MVGLPPRKLSSLLWPIKDDLALKTPGVYSIPCAEKCILDKLGIQLRQVKEHHQYIYLYHPKKSVVAEHSIKLGHWIQLQNTSILAKKLRQMDQPDHKGSKR